VPRQDGCGTVLPGSAARFDSLGRASCGCVYDVTTTFPLHRRRHNCSQPQGSAARRNGSLTTAAALCCKETICAGKNFFVVPKKALCHRERICATLRKVLRYLCRLRNPLCSLESQCSAEKCFVLLRNTLPVKFVLTPKHAARSL
jgi:hypothetical protein